MGTNKTAGRIWRGKPVSGSTTAREIVYRAHIVGRPELPEFDLVGVMTAGSLPDGHGVIHWRALVDGQVIAGPTGTIQGLAAATARRLQAMAVPAAPAPATLWDKVDAQTVTLAEGREMRLVVTFRLVAGEAL